MKILRKRKIVEDKQDLSSTEKTLLDCLNHYPIINAILDVKTFVNLQGTCRSIRKIFQKETMQHLMTYTPKKIALYKKEVKIQNTESSSERKLNKEFYRTKYNIDGWNNDILKLIKNRNVNCAQLSFDFPSESLRRVDWREPPFEKLATHVSGLKCFSYFPKKLALHPIMKQVQSLVTDPYWIYYPSYDILLRNSFQYYDSDLYVNTIDGIHQILQELNSGKRELKMWKIEFTIGWFSSETEMFPDGWKVVTSEHQHKHKERPLVVLENSEFSETDLILCENQQEYHVYYCGENVSDHSEIIISKEPYEF